MKFLKTYWSDGVTVTSNKNGRPPEKGQKIVLVDEIIEAEYWKDVTAKVRFRFSTEHFYTIDNVPVSNLNAIYNSIQHTVCIKDGNSNVCLNGEQIQYFIVTLNYNCLKLHVIKRKTGKIKALIEYLGEGL